jgi:hypothetical protein
MHDPTSYAAGIEPFSEALPVRDEAEGEQTVLTYLEDVGVWHLHFFESGWEFPDRWLGDTHWLDITAMWPGVIAQVQEFSAADEARAHRLTLAAETARDALEPFAAFIEKTDPFWDDDRRIATLNYDFDKLKLGLFRRAREALATLSAALRER